MEVMKRAKFGRLAKTIILCYKVIKIFVNKFFTLFPFVKYQAKKGDFNLHCIHCSPFQNMKHSLVSIFLAF